MKAPGAIVDLHVHTVRGASDSSLQPEELLLEAARIGLTGVNLSEHDRVWERRELEELRLRASALLVVNGMEVSTDAGHMIVVGLRQYVPGIRHLRELRRIADEEGAFVIAAHPFRYFFDPGHARRHAGGKPFDLSLEEAARLPVFELVDEIEVLNGGCTPRENGFALEVARLLGKRGVGGSDAHSVNGLGCYATVFERELRDEADLLQELRAGRFYPAAGLNVGRLVPYGEGADAPKA